MITGCEVSLWAGEQFASDMRLVFPKLKIEVLSANKILGSLGQRFAVPQPGFPHHRSALFLSKTTMVLIISHSGSTFASLASANLLKVVTPGAILQLWRMPRSSQNARYALATQRSLRSHRNGTPSSRASSVPGFLAT